MKTVFFLILVFAQIAGAKVVSATYDVSFGVFNALGRAEARLETREDQTYTIRIVAQATGMAKTLSGNRVETYESNGRIENGRLIPERYSKVRQTNTKKITKIYTFDHDGKIVWREVIEKGNRNREKNDYYAAEDILTLFFNLKYHLDGKHNRSIAAIGGNKEDGRIDIVFPSPKELAEMKRQLGTAKGEFLKVVLNDKIFASERGELIINLGSDNLCDKAILEDVLLFGDVVGVRVR